MQEYKITKVNREGNKSNQTEGIVTGSREVNKNDMQRGDYTCQKTTQFKAANGEKRRLRNKELEK